jgi:hypothetical protein
MFSTGFNSGARAGSVRARATGVMVWTPPTASACQLKAKTENPSFSPRYQPSLISRLLQQLGQGVVGLAAPLLRPHCGVRFFFQAHLRTKKKIDRAVAALMSSILTGMGYPVGRLPPYSRNGPCVACIPDVPFQPRLLSPPQAGFLLA